MTETIFNQNTEKLTEKLFIVEVSVLSNNINLVRNEINRINEVNVLFSLKQSEASGRNRKSVLNCIDKRIWQVLVEKEGINFELLGKVINSAPKYKPGLKKHPLPEEVKKEVMRRDNFRCQICKSPFGLVLHHIEPFGESIPSNLITLCRTCHSVVHTYLRLKGYPYYKR